MITVPMRRVETPHEVAYTCSSLPSGDWYVTSNALAKFWPRWCEVPAWIARRSCVNASMQYVWSAPANFSLSDLSPVSTGTAIHSSANRR